MIVVGGRPDITAQRIPSTQSKRDEYEESGLVFRTLEILHRLGIVDSEDIQWYEWKGYALDLGAEL